MLVQIDDQPITDYASLTNARQGHAAGDRLMVGYYRGPERRSVSMELSRRPLPTILWNCLELLRAVAGHYAVTYQALRDFFADVSEAEASHRPAAAEWSAKEVLAHLIHSERGFQTTSARSSPVPNSPTTTTARPVRSARQSPDVDSRPGV